MFAFLAPLFAGLGGTAATAGTSAALFSAGSMTAGSAMSASLLAGGAGAAGAGIGLGSILGIGASGLSILGTFQGAKAQKQQYMAQAKREEIEARQREIDRRQNLLRAIASQNAARGAQGIVGNQGSPAAMLRTDEQASYFDSTVNAANAEYRTGTSRANAAIASRQGTFDAASSLLDFAGRTIRRGSL